MADRAFWTLMTGSAERLPLPEHPLLAAWASAMNDAGYFANVLDADWRYVYDTDELLQSYRNMGVGNPPIGAHLFSAEARQYIAKLGGTWATWEARRAWFLNVGRYVLADTPGGREELRRVVDPELADLVDELEPAALPPIPCTRRTRRSLSCRRRPTRPAATRPRSPSVTSETEPASRYR